ncbi:Histidine triad (HIT) superfamily protein [Alteracholeplasma palmae J233]|uniref:Histidine triad (HIT) superfamily protein n=1 Tax=Alteracholeplasma palmae (strain ATCC 49389 / J233) TaxID=1318466 RepID=U4KQV9_ALTPJ|nr:HIT family protein [Alteracholeplasma palmae]CCV63646.1 Histidine triad (HIT) superfamily protein [Alteracholeplasma palmae J233]
MSTIFTKIINREIPSYIVYEDDLVLAFLDITQASKGHTLVVTKNEYKDITEVPEETLSHLFKVVQKISKGMFKAFNIKGINLLNNNGEVAGQTVFHYHVHIIPRYESNELNFVFENNMDKTSKEMFIERQNLIISSLN